MNIFFLVLVWAHAGFASSINYLQEITQKPKSELALLHEQIKYQSRKIRFLECPIELIEHQYNGSESVLIGIDFLMQFMRESEQIDPDYENIHDNCLDIIEEYYRQEKLNNIKRRALSAQELENIYNKNLFQDYENLALVVLNSLNKETLCQSKYSAASAFIFGGMSLGFYSMHCYTPLGRHFKLKGPSLGIGVGIGGALILPDSQRLITPLAYRIFLYQRNSNTPWYMTSMSSRAIMILGLALEQDHQKSMIYFNNYNAALGFGLSTEKSYRRMHESKKKSYFAKLVMTELFEDMAHTAY